MNFLIATDKFKGTLSAFEAASAIERGIRRSLPKASIDIFPMADGGDGFSRVMKHHLNTKTVRTKSVDPLFRNITADYEWDAKRKTAIIEVAACSGLTLLTPKERNPLHTSTYGTGLQIRHALKKGAKKIILGLGGSATNDGGMGILAALGFRFFDKKHQALAPVGASLKAIGTISAPATLPGATWVIACDVESPLYGKRGAAYTFAAQKGAGPATIKTLDEGLRNLARVIHDEKKIRIDKVKGMGAAGGILALLWPYVNGTLVNGAQLVIESGNLKAKLKKADWLISGEGQIDGQSFEGKVVQHIMKLAESLHKPLLLVCGKLDLADPKTARFVNKHSVLPLTSKKISQRKARLQAATLVTAAVARFFRKNIRPF